MNEINYERDNPEYSQLAQREYYEFLSSLQSSNKNSYDKKWNLRRLLLRWEWKIVIPKRKINTLSDILVRMWI